jgi:AmmeMemoRadiSam system protein B
MSGAIRKAAVQGSFYPEACEKVERYFKDFNHTYDILNISDQITNIVPRAIIVPHAGYIYSGFTANFAYRFLKHATPKRIIVIGPSHYHAFEGISGSYYETYETPCGALDIDSPYLFALAKTFNISFEPKAHEQEHSTEVQFPFIQHYFPNVKVIELIYGAIHPNTLAAIISALLYNKDNCVILSSDLSHFHDLKEAKVLDTNCLIAVQNLDISELKKGCEACGLTGIQAMILSAKQLKLSSKLLDYRTSADTSKDTSSVVGYMSAMFY